MNSNHNSSLYSKWYEYNDEYLLPTIPWAPHIVSYTENYQANQLDKPDIPGKPDQPDQPDQPDRQEKEDILKDDWTTVVIKKRKQNKF